MTRVLLTAILMTGNAFAADTTNPDQEFFMEAAAGGIAEVEAGKIAQSKGTSPQVREFGAKMVADHGKANTKLKGLAARKNITLPADTDAKHKATLAELEAASGRAFDEAYIKAQIVDHETTEALMKEEIASGKDSDARAFAQETLPTVSAHLQMVRAMATAAATAM